MLRLVEGFSHYMTVTELASGKWASNGGVSKMSFGVGDRGQRVLVMTPAISNGLRKTFENRTQWLVGFTFRYDKLPTAYTSLVRWLESTDIPQVEIGIQPDGTLAVINNIVQVGRSTVIAQPGVEYHVEFKVVIGDSPNGSTEVRVNNAVWINESAIDTRWLGDVGASKFEVRNYPVNGSSGEATVTYSDIYVLDTQAGLNDFLGVTHVKALAPDADVVTDFTPSTAAPHYDLVNEAVINFDDDYVESSTVGHQELLGLPSSGLRTIRAVQVVAAANGTSNLKTRLRSGASNAEGAALTLAGTGYQHVTGIFETDPATAAAWTEAGLAAAEIGAEVAA